MGALQWTLLFVAFVCTVSGVVWQWVYDYFCWECPECNPVPNTDTCKLAFKMWISGFEGAVVLVVTGFCIIVVAAFRELQKTQESILSPRTRTATPHLQSTVRHLA